MRTSLMILIVILTTEFALAKSLCDEQNLGWHFYCDPEIEKELSKKKETQYNGSVPEAKENLNKIKQDLEDLKIQAVMYPTKDNVFNYIKAQKAMLERSERFAEIWQKVLWDRPEIDYSVKRPTSTVGNNLMNEIAQEDLKNKIEHVKNRYGIFFIYSTTCPYCIQYSKIIKAFSEYYNLNVQGVSVDGNFLEEWPDSIVNKGQLAKFGLEGKPVPATILFDNKSKRLVPIGYGLLTIDEIEKRISKLLEVVND